GLVACAVAFGDVAGAAGGLEVVEVPPWAAEFDGDDVVDFGGGGGAVGVADLAEVLVAFEDGAADAFPGAAVDGVVSLAGHWVSPFSGTHFASITMSIASSTSGVSLIAEHFPDRGDRVARPAA